jgi:hypothetical protein
MRISIVSDIPWGYGSPQVGYLKDSLGARKIEIQFIVPSYSERPLLLADGITEILGEGRPFSWEGMVGFGKRAAKLVSKFDPNKIVIVNPRSLAAIPFLKKSDADMIYYGLEPITDHGKGFTSVIALQKFQFQIGIFPNIERAIADATTLSIPPKQIRIIRNVPKLSDHSPTITNKEKGITYVGSLDAGWVNLEVLDYAASLAPLKIWGHAEKKLSPKISQSYQGALPHSQIGKAFGQADLSLILWKPVNFGTKNAAPNKFFEAMSFGVPSVSFPYPQVVELVSKHGIGFVADSFSIKSFNTILTETYKMVESQQFKEIKEMCLILHKNKLNWELESAAVIDEIISAI